MKTVFEGSTLNKKLTKFNPSREIFKKTKTKHSIAKQLQLKKHTLLNLKILSNVTKTKT